MYECTIQCEVKNILYAFIFFVCVCSLLYAFIFSFILESTNVEAKCEQSLFPEKKEGMAGPLSVSDGC